MLLWSYYSFKAVATLGCQYWGIGEGEREEEIRRKGEGISLFLGKGRENGFQGTKRNKKYRFTHYEDKNVIT